MKVKYILYIAIIFNVLLNSSCAKDEGNYKYVEVSELKIDTIGMANRLEMYSLELGKTLQLKPNVTYYKDISELEYYWIIYPYPYEEVQEGNAMVFPKADTISHSHELNWIVNITGSYYLQFVAMDPEIGTKTFFSFATITVPEKGVKSGLYILSEYDGKSDIDLFGSARALIIGGNHFTPKYYSSLHGGEMINGKPNFISYGKEYYYVFTESEAERLNIAGLQLMDEFQNMFYSTPEFKPQNLIYTNNCEFLLNNGKLHVLYTNMANDRKFSAPIGSDYNAAPFLYGMTRTSYGAVANAIGSDQVIFDKNRNAFRPYYPMATEVSQFKETVPGAYVNVNNMPKDIVASFQSDAGKTYNIMKINGVDSLHIINFYNVVDDGDLSVGGNSRISLSGCNDIGNAKYFASSTAGTAFFYATNKAVYSFTPSSGQTKQIDIYKCASDEEVTCLYVLPSGGFPTAGCVLWIAVWNEGRKEGKLVEFEVDPYSGAIRNQWSPIFAPDLSNPSVTTGFGKIKSMIIKM